MTTWYETLPTDQRESLFAAMRALDTTAQQHRTYAAKLAPPAGTIAVGGAHFDEVLKAEVIEGYLRALRAGDSPRNALTAAEANRTAIVKSWNKSRGKDYVVHRAETAEQSLIESILRTVLRSSEVAP